jgi:hypothetical protein
MVGPSQLGLPRQQVGLTRLGWRTPQPKLGSRRPLAPSRRRATTRLSGNLRVSAVISALYLMAAVVVIDVRASDSIRIGRTRPLDAS